MCCAGVFPWAKLCLLIHLLLFYTCQSRTHSITSVALAIRHADYSLSLTVSIARAKASTQMKKSGEVTLAWGIKWSVDKR